jgi:hypothetical protein
MADASEPPRSALDTAFKPYAMEIGFLLREWNDLQERLLSLFITLLRWPNEEIGRSIWYAVQNDRSQRRMLLGARRHSTIRLTRLVRSRSCSVTMTLSALRSGTRFCG